MQATSHYLKQCWLWFFFTAAMGDTAKNDENEPVEWTYLTFGCFDDPKLCIFTFLFPCYTIGRNAEAFEEDGVQVTEEKWPLVQLIQIPVMYHKTLTLKQFPILYKTTTFIQFPIMYHRILKQIQPPAMYLKHKNVNTISNNLSYNLKANTISSNVA